MRAFAFLAIVLLTVSLAFAQSVFHPASQVAPGVFGSDLGDAGIGNFTFNSSMFVVDKLGIGTTNPEYTLDVNGDARWSGTLQGGAVPWSRVTGAPAFITNGNQGWSNIYGYITSGNTGWSNIYGFITNGNQGWSNSYGFITAASTITGLVQSTASGNSYFTGGNVGIGKTNPTTQLYILGANPSITLDESGSSNSNLIFSRGASQKWLLLSNYGSPTDNIAFYDTSVSAKVFQINPGNDAVAMGYNTAASNYHALATGYNTLASGHTSIAMGYYTTASGDNSPIAIGRWVTASGQDNSHVIGVGASNSERLVNSISYSLMIGYNSTVPTLFVGPGSGAGTTGNVGIGTTNPGSFKLYVNGSLKVNSATTEKITNIVWTNPSDARLKNVVGTYNHGLTEILQINPIRYTYKENNGLGIVDPGEHIGIIAQDVQSVIPEAITTGSDGYLRFTADPVIWAVVNAIKELKTEDETLKSKNLQLEERVKLLEAKLNVGQ